jgi:hypothetical protein
MMEATIPGDNATTAVDVRNLENIARKRIHMPVVATA